MKSFMSLTRVLTVVLCAIALFAVSCKKEGSATDSAAAKEEFAIAASESDAEAEVIFDDVFDNVVGVDTEVGIGGTGVFGSANFNSGGFGEESVNGANGTDTTRCFTVTYTQLSPPARFPLKVVIDFGAGCTGRDGRVRKGKIIIVYTGRLFIPGNSTTTTFDGYYVNDVKVEGTHKISNMSTSNIIAFRVEVLQGKLSKPNGNYTQWNSDKTVGQIEGVLTPFNPFDDIFAVSGAANGSVKKGDRLFQWATLIKEPLLKKFTCRWISKGVISMQKNTSPVAELDYGSGTCDNKATLTVNGQSREITLH